MGFDWSEYLELAKNLAGLSQTNAGEEARNRAAISRAYYAAFGKACEFLESRDGKRIPRDGSAHGTVIQAFEDHRDLNRQRIGENLKRLRQHRNKADYDSIADPKRPRLQTIVDITVDVLRSLRSI